MSTIALVGIDLSKKIFQLHRVDARGKMIFRKKLSRSKCIEFIANLPACTLAMEACAGAHFFARKFRDFGHDVKLIAPQYVAPFVKGNKNDAADAAGISEAAQRPEMRFVAPKTTDQQDLQFIHRVRKRLVKNQTALINEIRGMLYEYGIVISIGRSALDKAVQTYLATNDYSLISLRGQQLLQTMYSELLEIDQRIDEHVKGLKRICQSSEKAQKLQKIGGLGVLIVSALLIPLADPQNFEDGRQFAAWLGLVPRHQGTGGKNRVLGISKRGNSREPL